MQDLARSALDQLGRRILDPFAGLYLSILATWNWKPIAILLFDERPIVARINYVENAYLADVASCFLRFLVPLAITLFLFFVYPRIRAFFVLYHEERALVLRRKKEDLAAMPEAEPRLIALEKDRRKLAVVESEYFRLYLDTVPSNRSGSFKIYHCESAEHGQFVNIVGNSCRIALWESRPLQPPDGIVIRKFHDGFVLVQTQGTIDWDIFYDSQTAPSEPSTEYFLDRSGFMTSRLPDATDIVSVGEAILDDGKPFLRLHIVKFRKQNRHSAVSNKLPNLQ